MENKMTREKVLEKIDIMYNVKKGDYDEAVRYITNLYGLTPEFWKNNFAFINDSMLSKYPALYFGGVI